MPDKLRRDDKVMQLVREFAATGKLVAAICHGGWIPISAGVYRGVRVTGSPGIKDDLVNAGAHLGRRPGRHRPPLRLQPQARRPARFLPCDSPGADKGARVDLPVVPRGCSRGGMLRCSNQPWPYAGWPNWRHPALPQ